MAEIFLAKALGVMGFERLVAIKLIHSQLTRDQEFVKMFIDEARIAMHLQHRNIVQVFDLDKTGDTYFTFSLINQTKMRRVSRRITATDGNPSSSTIWPLGNVILRRAHRYQLCKSL